MSFNAGSVEVRCPQCGMTVRMAVRVGWVTAAFDYLSVQLVQTVNAKHVCEKSP
jgi:hypothetical protein